MPLDFDPPFCSCGMLMSPNNGAIDRMGFPIHLPSRITLLLQGLQDVLPHTCFLPAVKAARNGSPRAIVFGQISPRRSRSQYPQDPIDDHAMVVGWTTRLGL